MNKEIRQTEGIVLKAIPLRDYEQLLTLFTPDAGMVKIIHKEKQKAVYQPLTKVEFGYREKKGEIFSSCGIYIIDAFPILRTQFSYIECSCDFAHALLTSQYLGKEAPLLYQLFDYYLQKISYVVDPWTLAASFRLKLLKHEGLAHFPLVCSSCQTRLIDHLYAFESECWCKIHAQNKALSWDKEEIDNCYFLANCRQYQEIQNKEISKENLRKIFLFFDACFK